MSSNRTNLKKTQSQQKHAIRTIHSKGRFTHARKQFGEIKILNVFQHNILNNLVFEHKIKSHTAPKIFQNNSVNQLISILLISPHPTTVYHHLHQVSLNKEFQSEAPTLWEKSFWNLKMKYRISKSTCLKSWNTFSKSPKVFSEQVVLNSMCFLGSVCGGVSFLLIVRQTASGFSGFALHRRFFSFFFFSCVFCDFLSDCVWKHLCETASGAIF